MIDPTPNETKAMEQAGILAGEYLDYLKKSDLAELTPEEYNMFIQCVVSGYIETMQKLTG